MAQSKLAPLCKAENHICSTLYGELYRAKFSVGGASGDWNILHIVVPLSEEKMKALREISGVADDVADYHKKLSATITRAVRANAALFADEKAENAKNASARIVYKDMVKREDGSGATDLYFVTGPAMPLLNTEPFKGTPRLRYVLRAALGVAELIRSCNKDGYSIGVIDPANIYVDEERYEVAAYPMGEKGKGVLVSELPPELTAHLWVQDDGICRRSREADVYSLSSLLWAVLSGQPYHTKPDLDQEPEYSTPELTEILRSAMTERKGAVIKLISGLNSAIKAIDDGVLDDRELSHTNAYSHVSDLTTTGKLEGVSGPDALTNEKRLEMEQRSMKRWQKIALLAAMIIVPLALLLWNMKLTLDLKQAQNNLELAAEAIVTVDGKVESARTSLSAMTKENETLKASVDELTSQIGALGGDTRAMENIQKQIKNLSSRISANHAKTVRSLLALKGLKEKSGKFYRFNKDNEPVKGWFTIGDYTFYTNEDGLLVTGWLETDDAKYYLKETGVMAVNETVTVEGEKYKFDAKGRLIEG